MSSIRDIAARAGVSIGTVDRVLNNRGRVSKQTRARVKRIIRKLDYHPNIYARNLSLSRTYHFTVLMPRQAQDSNYWRLPARGVQKAAKELEAYRIRVRIIHFDRYSADSFERSLNVALDAKPDGLLLAPLHSSAGRLLSSSSGLPPYVFFDSSLPLGKPVATISQNPFQSGLLASRLLTMTANGGGTVAAVRVLPEDFHINERIRGFQAGMDGTNGVRVRIYDVDSQGGLVQFRDLVTRLLQENKNLTGLFVSNAWTHPVARYCRARCGKKSPTLVGFDLVPENKRLLESGAIDFLISQRPELQGYKGIYALYRHVVLREHVRAQSMVPLDILTRDNFRYHQD